MIRIHTAVIEHSRHGSSLFHSLTEAGLQAQLIEYVRENWEDELPEHEKPEVFLAEHDLTPDDVEIVID